MSWVCANPGIKVCVISVGHGSVRTCTLAVLGLYKGVGHQCGSVGTRTLEVLGLYKGMGHHDVGHGSVRTYTLAVLGLYKGMGHQCGSWICENADFGSAGPV